MLRIPAASFLPHSRNGDLPANASYATERTLGIPGLGDYSEHRPSRTPRQAAPHHPGRGHRRPDHPLSQIASAQATARAVPSSGPKPTIVLEHGAWANTASWDAVIQRLQADGYTVDAPPNPLQGLPYDSSYLVDFLHSISGPIILVGHSYGGAVFTNAATGDSQVKALVYVDAFAPAQGQTLAQLLAAYPGSCVVPANLNVVPFPGAPAGVGDAYIKQSVFPSCMANDLPAIEAHVLAATQEPIATIALAQQSGGHRRSRHPAGVAASHGPHGARPYHQGRRAAPLHDLPSRYRDERDPAS